MYAPTFLIKRLIKTSRGELRELLAQSIPTVEYTNGMRIGKSHMLAVAESLTLSVKRVGQRISVGLPKGENLNSPAVVKKLREVIQASLRLEAKSYLPKRLSYIAKTYGYNYSQVRFSHASGRWGSCSSQGTISLNIALMKLPFELIDYVLIH
jgi:predicted metal-dependent hydrolase